MADFKLFFNTLLREEGGYNETPGDKGGATNMGIALATWIAYGVDYDHDGDIDKQDLKHLTKDDAYRIAKKVYWDRVKGDSIKNQSIAEFIFDWGYNSGSRTAIVHVQRILGLTQDGEIGPITLNAINTAPQENLFNQLKNSRNMFFHAIVDYDLSQYKFLAGWLKRNNAFTFKP